MRLPAPGTTRARIVGLDSTRPPCPPFLGIAWCRTRLGRDVRVTRAGRLGSSNSSTPLAAMAAKVTPSIPGAPLLALASCEASWRVSGVQLGPDRPQNRQDGAAFAWASLLRRRSCRWTGVFGIAPLPPMVSQALRTGGSLRSTGLPLLHHSYGPLRPPRIFG